MALVLRREKVFQVSKELLTSSKVLVHFNPKHMLVLACDASAYRVGAVLVHKLQPQMIKNLTQSSASVKPVTNISSI